MFKEWFSMGDYGAYVWPSYFIVFAALSMLIYKTISHRKQVLAELRKRLKQGSSHDASSL